LQSQQGFNEQHGKIKEALTNWGGAMEVESITLHIRFPGREDIPNDGMMGRLEAGRNEIRPWERIS